MTREEYYIDRNRITSHMLGWLKISPSYFYVRFNSPMDEKKKSYYRIGEALHCLLLEPEEFNKRYMVQSFETPSNSKQKEYLDLIIESVKARNLISPKLKTFPSQEDRVNLYKTCYSVAGKSDAKIDMDSFSIVSKYKDYISSQVLYSDSSVQLLTPNDMSRINDMADKIYASPISKLFLEKPQDNIEVYNELIIEFDISLQLLYEIQNKIYSNYLLTEISTSELRDNVVPMKAMIDKLIINHETKEIFIVDLKTFSTEYPEFGRNGTIIDELKSGIFNFGYNRQLSVYETAVCAKFLNDKKYDDYMLTSVLIFVQSDGNNDVYPVELSNEMMNTGYVEFAELLELYSRCLLEGDFSPSVFYTKEKTYGKFIKI